MAKRTILISSFPVCIILGVIALVFALRLSSGQAGIGRGEPTYTSADIEQSRLQIISLADENKLTEVDEAIDKLTNDYAGSSELPSNLLTIADGFAWRRLYDKAARLYRHIPDLSTDNSLTTKARLGLARVEILNLIGQKEYSAAREQLEYMTADFRDEPDLSAALFQIGQEFIWQRRYIEAKNAFDHIIETQPNSPLAQQAGLWSARANVCALIRQNKDEHALAAIDKLINDFGMDVNLPEAIYWISKEYEWTRGTVDNRAGWYDKPNSVYQRLVQQFSDTSYGQAAELDKRRLTHRMKIFKLMKEADQNEIDAAIGQMVSEFSGRPELVDELLWIACGYEEQPNKAAQAKQMYERIIKEYPETVESKHIALHNRRMDIHILIEAGDVNGADILIDELLANFTADSELPNALYLIGRHYYTKAIALIGDEGHKKETDLFLQEAVRVWERLTQLPASEFTAAGCYATADCYYRLGDYNMAINYHKKIMSDFPDYKNTCISMFMVADCYDKLASAGRVSQDEAGEQISGIYKELLARYPDCKLPYSARIRLQRWVKQ
jgi:outer membrane protein assembly factor BamD (BamD/ComL family)